MASATVVVLTASYGSGHNAAAHSLAAAFTSAGARPLVVDHFRDLVHPLFERISRRLYYGMLRRAPVAWGAAYALGDWLTSDSPLVFGATRLGATRLLRLLAAQRPDAVVTVHATPAVVMSELAATTPGMPSHTTVVTDFVAHSQWIAPAVSRYCVAADEVRHDFVARGIPADHVTVTGVPVRGEFEQPVDAHEARRAFGLSPRLPVVLAMAGSRGSFGRLPEVTQALLGLRTPFQGVIVAGQDSKVARRLRSLVAGSSIRVLEYVPGIRTLMAAADVLVTKAGGMTLAEGMAADVPLVLYGSLPGQERRNERFATRNGIALVARTPTGLMRAVERAITDPALLDRLHANAERLRRPDASRRVVDLVLGEVFKRR
jgi:processive 1,2-diacylglycerol beta-glucosyltransferase